MKKVAVFLDRDGTINIDTGYVSSPEDFDFLPAAKKGLKLLQENGFLLFIVTNQSGLNRGFFTLHDLGKIHSKLEEELAEEGVRLEKIFFCPHHPDERCECRKPSPAAVLQIAEQYGIDLRKSFFIGDKVTDVRTGINAGCRSILLASPEEVSRLKREGDWQEPDYVVPDLYAAALLVGRLKNQGTANA